MATKRRGLSNVHLMDRSAPLLPRFLGFVTSPTPVFVLEFLHLVHLFKNLDLLIPFPDSSSTIIKRTLVE